MAISETTMNPTRRKRGLKTQAEKSAETRRKLVDGAIRCLHARGYGATTVEQILQDSGVKRGTMIHQFPTRVDLMLEVVRCVYEDEGNAIYTRTMETDDPIERILRIPELAFELYSRPAGVAVLEILLASRSDPVLSAALGPLQTVLEERTADNLRRVTEDAGLDPGEEGPVIRRMLTAAARGLAIDLIFSEDQALVSRTAQFLRTTLERHYAPQIAKIRRAQARTAAKVG